MSEYKAGDRIRLKTYEYKFEWGGAVVELIGEHPLLNDPQIWAVKFEDPEIAGTVDQSFAFHEQHFDEVLESEPTKAPATNKMLAEWEKDLERMLILETDLRGYRMEDTAKALNKDTGVLLNFIQALKFSLRKDGLYEE